ncbi:unnamed protein product [Peniophora sp. CBMAI 1063]|nr:unnamed protein product [Peniophora sp. CBMAI 1063]
MSDHLYWLDSRTPTIYPHFAEPSFATDPFDASDYGLPSLEEITRMVQHAFDEALQERGYNSIAYAEPEPVYEPPSSRGVARPIEPDISVPDTSVSVSAAVIYDVLDDFVTDQCHLAPIVSIAGYNTFKHQFDALTDPLVSLSIVKPHVRDAYFADALQLSPLDHAVVFVALASISPDADRPYPAELVDAVVRQYFSQASLELELDQQPLRAFVNDPDVFAARPPPSCPLFSVAISDSANQDEDFILHPHSGSYAMYNETGLSAQERQLSSPCPFLLDIPTTQCADDLSAPNTPYVPPYTPDFDRSDGPDCTFPPYAPLPISLEPQLYLDQPQPSPPVLPYVPSESVPSPHELFKHGSLHSSTLQPPKSLIEASPVPNVADTNPMVKMPPEQDIVEPAVALPPVRDADPLLLKNFYPPDFAAFQSVQPLLELHGSEQPDLSFAVPPSPAIIEDTVVPPRNTPSSPQTENAAAEEVVALPPEIRLPKKPGSDSDAAFKSVPCLSPRKSVSAKPASSPPDVAVERTGPEICAEFHRQSVMVVQDEPCFAPLPSLSPRSEFPIVAYPSPPSRPSMVDILATAYLSRSPRRLPLHLALRPRRVPPHFRFRHNVLRARSISAARVRAPGSDPPSQQGYPVNIKASPVESPLPC